jgi:hypothetical protein
MQWRRRRSRNHLRLGVPDIQTKTKSGARLLVDHRARRCSAARLCPGSRHIPQVKARMSIFCKHGDDALGG